MPLLLALEVQIQIAQIALRVTIVCQELLILSHARLDFIVDLQHQPLLLVEMENGEMRKAAKVLEIVLHARMDCKTIKF